MPMATISPATPASESVKPWYLLSSITASHESSAAVARLKTDTIARPR